MKPDASDIDRYVLPDDGTFPNSGLPLLHYHGVLRERGGSLAEAFERRFSAAGWGGMWRNGVFAYHHYHSTTPESLGAFAGRARVLFGGDGGVTVEVRAGDLVVIPPGVAHKAIEASADFGVVAAYPKGLLPDMCYGRHGERPDADRRIALVPVPETDPVDGPEGPLVNIWGSGDLGSSDPGRQAP
jgi:uncharacterized protein YjlB